MADTNWQPTTFLRYVRTVPSSSRAALPQMKSRDYGKSSIISESDCRLIYPARQSKMRLAGENYDSYANNRISG